VGLVGMHTDGHADEPIGLQRRPNGPCTGRGVPPQAKGWVVAAPPWCDIGVHSRDASTTRMRMYDWVRVVAALRPSQGGGGYPVRHLRDPIRLCCCESARTVSDCDWMSGLHG
jgi:hypothetical protein